MYVHFRYDSAGSNFASASTSAPGPGPGPGSDSAPDSDSDSDSASAAVSASADVNVSQSVYSAIYCATFVIIIAMPQLKAPSKDLAKIYIKLFQVCGWLLETGDQRRKTNDEGPRTKTLANVVINTLIIVSKHNQTNPKHKHTHTRSKKGDKRGPPGESTKV